MSLWRKEAENKTGRLAQTLEPIARRADPGRCDGGIGFPAMRPKAAIEIYPVSGKKFDGCRHWDGACRFGYPDSPRRKAIISQVWRHKIAQTIADTGADLSFFVAKPLVEGIPRVIGFANDADAKRASTLIKKAAEAINESNRAKRTPPICQHREEGCTLRPPRGELSR